VYVDGTAVRKLQTAPEERKQKQQKPSVSQETQRNRERALSMNVGYVTFLTVAAVISVFMCVNFLQLQAKGTKLQKEVTALETQLSAAILENDSDYNRIMTSVDMEHVKDVAMNELGMSYAKKSQIVTYEMEDNDYVRQYSEIPEE
jgi:cell division protein FtsL